MSLAGKVVFVCGAGPGVGRSVAVGAAARGADVALLARSRQTTDAARAALQETKARVLTTNADVADSAAVRRAMDATIAHFGRIDVLVHSILPSHLLKPVLELAESDLPAWRRSVDTSVFGALNVSRTVAHAMARQGGGSIVFVTATSALQGYPTVSAHAAGKAGIHALAQCLAAELGPRGIRVNCVAPGVIEGATVRSHIPDDGVRAEFVAAQAALNATRRMPTDGDVAEAVLFLASDAAAGITGQILAVDGGRLFH